MFKFLYNSCNHFPSYEPMIDFFHGDWRLLVKVYISKLEKLRNPFFNGGEMFLVKKKYVFYLFCISATIGSHQEVLWSSICRLKKI